jgi:small subunit ribosomal protein S2
MSEEKDVEVQESVSEEIQREELTEVQENVSEETQESQELFSIKDLLEAGVHFGHRTMRWNAKMLPYIYGIRNNIHIIDLTQTAILLSEAMRILKEVVRKRGRVLFVCTKKQGSESIKKLAIETNQFYVNHKWLGGMLTNWKTVSQSIKKIKTIENQLSSEDSRLLKKELIVLGKEKEKLENNLGGIRTMGSVPDLLFVIDTVKESLAINEARALGIPVMAIIDTNSNPDVVDYPIPGNDDSIKAIQLYCRIISEVLKNVSVPRTEKRPETGQNFRKRKTTEIKKNDTRKPSFRKNETARVQDNNQ